MSDMTPQEAISVALELSDSFSAEEVSRQIIDAISAAGYEIVRKRPVSGGCALDMDAMERRARWYVTAGIPPQLASAYTDVLALIARVRELEAEVAAQKAIISTSMSAFSYGRSQGREEGVAVERKRCAEVAREHIRRVDAVRDNPRFSNAYNFACGDIAAAIERGDK